MINLKINRIIIHQIFQRDLDGNKIKPLQGHEYTRFAAEAMENFRSRVIDALGEDSKAVEMEIVDQDEHDLPKLIDTIISQDDDAFAVSSYDIAVKLTEAQQRKSIPGGIVVVFTGTQGYLNNRFLGIIKAEIHSGYEKEVNPDTNEISLKFVEELLLTPGTKLYKTAAFLEKDTSSTKDIKQKWKVLVSDSQISKTDGKAAAEYFYSDFLGCGYPETSARRTKQFYEVTSSFIDSLKFPDEKKYELMNALHTYLKVDQSSVVNPTEFATTYFDTNTQDSYTVYLEDKEIPLMAFTKDIEHIQSKLKIRKINFSRNVKLTAPSDVFNKYVLIETIDGELDESGGIQKWTKIIVKDQIALQE